MGLFQRKFRIMATPSLETACELYREGVLNYSVFYIFETEARDKYKAITKIESDLASILKVKNTRNEQKGKPILDTSNYEFEDISTQSLADYFILVKELKELKAKVEEKLKPSEYSKIREYTQEQEYLLLSRLRDYNIDELRYITLKVVSLAFTLLRDISSLDLRSSFNCADAVTYSECVFTISDALHGYSPLVDSLVYKETIISDLCKYNLTVYKLQALTSRYYGAYSLETILNNFDEYKENINWAKVF